MNLSYKTQRFMQGRYGVDRLSDFLIICGAVFVLLANFKHLHFLYAVGAALVIWSFFRAFSKNYDKRCRELAAYQRFTAKPKAWLALEKSKWRDRKTHRYYKCRNCKAVLRVPKGRGKIEISCPKCSTKLIKKT